jgi:hypothetical protein
MPNLRQTLRRHRRFMKGALISIHVISGITLIAFGDLPTFQGALHVAIGILHGIA